MSATATAPKSFSYNPDAPAWEPSAEAMAKVDAAMAAASATISAAATDAFVPRPKPIIIALDREVRLFPMKEPRTKGIDEVLGWLGMIVTDGDEDSVPKDFPKEKVYDYGCHYNDYRLESCLRSMPGYADPTLEELGNFPKNIQDYFWLDDGLKDEHPWRALCRLTTGLFVYVRASCTYSGFGCMGGISIYAAKHPQTLVDHGMTEEDRRRFARIFNKPSAAAKKPAYASAAGSAGASQLNRPSKMGGGGSSSDINRPSKGPLATASGGALKKPTVALKKPTPARYPMPATVPAATARPPAPQPAGGVPLRPYKATPKK